MTDLAALTGLGWDTVKNIVKDRLEHDYGHPHLRSLQRLSIDEIYFGRRKKFYTLVIDLDTGQIVWVAKGKGGEALRPFWRALRFSLGFGIWEEVAKRPTAPATPTNAKRVRLRRALFAFVSGLGDLRRSRPLVCGRPRAAAHTPLVGDGVPPPRP